MNSTTEIIISPEHLAIPKNAVAEMVAHASARENRATNRIVIDDAREQVAYWTEVLTVIVAAHSGPNGARLHANWLIGNAAHGLGK
jgi:hypothetical protein